VGRRFDHQHVRLALSGAGDSLTPQRRLRNVRSRVAAAILQVDQRLADTGQISFGLRICIQVPCGRRRGYPRRWPSRLVKNQFTSGCVKRYADVDAETPDATTGQIPPRCNSGDSATGRGHGEGRAPKHIAPAIGTGADRASYRTPRVRAESNMDRLLHRKWRDRNH